MKKYPESLLLWQLNNDFRIIDRLNFNYAK